MPKKDGYSARVWGSADIKDEKSWLAKYGKKEEKKEELKTHKAPLKRMKSFSDFERAVPDATAVNKREKKRGTVGRDTFGEKFAFAFDEKGKRDMARATRRASR